MHDMADLVSEMGYLVGGVVLHKQNQQSNWCGVVQISHHACVLCAAHILRAARSLLDTAASRSQCEIGQPCAIVQRVRSKEV